jgi:MmyB-like transcription regulator ligand binding domain
VEAEERGSGVDGKAHNVRARRVATQHFRHRDVSDLELAYKSVEIVSEPGLTLTLYVAEPASPIAPYRNF